MNSFHSLTGAPKFVTQPKDTIAIQDQPAKFECLVDALPKPKLTWLLNGKELTNKEVKFETDAKTSANFMVIPKVTSTNFGTYTIKASNSVGEIECNFNLDVLGKQKLKIANDSILQSQASLLTRVFELVPSFAETPKIAGKLENVTVNEGQEAKFTIKIAGGKPKPTVKWFKEEEEIVVTTVETYEIVEVEDTVTLIIKSAKPDNSGNYYVQLVNEAGQISSNKASLTVNSMFDSLKSSSKVVFCNVRILTPVISFQNRRRTSLCQGSRAVGTNQQGRICQIGVHCRRQSKANS